MDFYSVSDFYKQKFGCKVYKISLDAGCTCPTRDGSKGTRGCIFCSGKGSGDFVPQNDIPIYEQVQKAKELVNRKFNHSGKEVSGRKYIAYFQSFTSTYARTVWEEELLKNKFLEAIRDDEIVGIDIATRPDCISDSMLTFFGELSKKTFVTIELGFQTSNEKTALYIRRGYENSVYLNAVKRIHETSKDIHIVTHLIFGLPGETRNDMLASVKTVVESGSDGVKFTVLYVLKGTDLALDYEEGKFVTLGMEEYFSIVKEAVNLLPENMVVHRVTGDGPKNSLIAPLWTADKKKVLNFFRRY